ncbi:hypothetical protein GCM10009760_18580 [Kitasatospora kazusensis]|uniref:Prohead serine protease domain-containing protein n=1 Tax=Kitasatospora kazusensis TaxID=407974 RepID=A0ABP5KUY8_9ACTN
MDFSARNTQPSAIERRSMPFRGVELRSKPNGTGGEVLHFEGYACVTETGYEMQDWLGPFTEVVRAGAFTRTLADNADVPFLLNHSGMTLARTKSGTLRLAEDSTGLHTDADLDPANPDVAALRSAMSRGDLDEMSFAFWVRSQQWSPDYSQRDILDVDLDHGDVSLVNYGANPATSAQMNARDAEHVQRLTADERRALFDRLAAEFAPAPPGAPAGLRLWQAQAAALAL